MQENAPMANLNKVMLIGRLTRDPESIEVRGAVSGAKFGFAVNNRKQRGRQVPPLATAGRATPAVPVGTTWRIWGALPVARVAAGARMTSPSKRDVASTGRSTW